VNRARLDSLLQDLAHGRVTAAEALGRLTHFPTEDLTFARIDHHRALRLGQPEVVFAEGKTVDQLVTICERLAAANHTFLATRVTDTQGEALSARFPDLQRNVLGRCAWLPAPTRVELVGGTVMVVTAGTSDLPVAEEAAAVLEAMGARVERMRDIGVAGLHRVLAASEQLGRAAAVIVVAGMEGALPSVVGGMVAAPVIAVPTSIGYGASFGGIAALLGMLNSCAPGVTVVNIDNGFGAAMAAVRLLTARVGAP
jgi:NCAIR mutase (PurE)-related protein